MMHPIRWCAYQDGKLFETVPTIFKEFDKGVETQAEKIGDLTSKSYVELFEKKVPEAAASLGVEFSRFVPPTPGTEIPPHNLLPSLSSMFKPEIEPVVDSAPPAAAAAATTAPVVIHGMSSSDEDSDFEDDDVFHAQPSPHRADQLFATFNQLLGNFDELLKMQVAHAHAMENGRRRLFIMRKHRLARKKKTA